MPAPVAQRLARTRAVLFDLDGTLIDTIELILTSFRHATRIVLGHSLPDDVLLRNVGVPLARQMSEFSAEKTDELLRVYREFNAEEHDRIAREYPGTEAVLEELSTRGLALGVVTSKGTRMALRGLRHFDLERFFGVVVTADDVRLHKPDPFPLVHAAELLGVDIRSCLYVGDSPHDMEAALAAGAVAVAALWGAFPEEDLLAPGPDFALSALSELPLLLDGGHDGFVIPRK